MSNVTPFTVKTERGESRSGHGISFVFNSTASGKAARKAQEKRRLARRTVRASWSNSSRGKAQEVVLDYGKAA